MEQQSPRPVRARFPLAAKLRGKKRIQELFSKGSSFFSFPFKVFYMPAVAGAAPPPVLFSVPKKFIRSAVGRNRVKRRIREQFRLQRHRLTNLPYSRLAFVYVAKEVLPTAQITRKLEGIFQKLISQAPLG